MCTCRRATSSAGLQSADADVDVGGLRRHGQPRCGRAGFRSLVVGQRRFASTAQAAENIQLPACAEVGFIGIAVAVETGPRVQDLPQRRFNGLVGPGGLAAEVARRQQGGIRRPQSRAGLGDASGRLRKVEVLRQRKRDEASQLRVAEACPTRRSRSALVAGGALLDGRLAEVLRPAGAYRAGHSRGRRRSLPRRLAAASRTRTRWSMGFFRKEGRKEALN